MGQSSIATEKTARGMTVFIFLWLGSTVSSLGDCLAGFSLNVWLLQTTESINVYTLGLLCMTLPVFFLAPLSGVVVDRWPRRWIIIIAEIGSALCYLTIALLFISDSLKIWHIYALTALSVSFSEFESLAFRSAVSLVVEPEDLARASGLTRVGDSIAQLSTPAIAGFLLSIIQIQGILLINCASFIIGIIPILLIRIPELQASSDKTDSENTSLIQQINQGWTYLGEQAGLFSLISVRAVHSFIANAGSILFVPMVLHLATPSTLGVVLSTAEAGTVIGGILMITWASRQERLIPVIYSLMFLGGFEAIASGIRPSLTIIAIAAFLFLLTLPLIDGSVQVILQKYVPPELQGRVFALNNAVTSLATLVAISSGSAVDLFLEPVMAFDGPWSEGIGQIIGTGPGRGIGLMFIIMGSLSIITASIAYRYSPLSQVEHGVITS